MYYIRCKEQARLLPANERRTEMKKSTTTKRAFKTALAAVLAIALCSPASLAFAADEGHGAAIEAPKAKTLTLGEPAEQGATEELAQEAVEATEADAAAQANGWQDDPSRIVVNWPEEGEAIVTEAADEMLVEEVHDYVNANASALPADGTKRQEVSWSRLAGATAYDTMTSITKKGWTKSSTVVIATFNGYWDALSASALAGKNAAPILFTDPNNLNAKTAAEVKRLGATKAIVVGGKSAVSDKVITQLKGQGLSVTRIAGANAQDTAVAVAKNFKGAATCIVATSNGYWDALSASPYAYWAKAPIYLTDASGNLTTATLSAIKAGGHKTAIVAGGTAAVSAKTATALKNAGLAVKRYGGANAYETSALLAAWEVSQGMTYANAGISTASGYWDALAGGAFCGAKKSVLMLADDGYTTFAAAKVKPVKTTMKAAYIFGGPSAVGTTAQNALAEATMSVFKVTKYENRYVVDKAAWTEKVNHPATTVKLVPAYQYIPTKKIVAMVNKVYTEQQRKSMGLGQRTEWYFDASFNDPGENLWAGMNPRPDDPTSMRIFSDFVNSNYKLVWVDPAEHKNLMSDPLYYTLEERHRLGANTPSIYHGNRYKNNDHYVCNICGAIHQAPYWSKNGTGWVNFSSDIGHGWGGTNSLCKCEHAGEDGNENRHEIGTQASDFKTKTKPAWTETINHPEQGHTEKIPVDGRWV